MLTDASRHGGHIVKVQAGYSYGFETSSRELTLDRSAGSSSG